MDSKRDIFNGVITIIYFAFLFAHLIQLIPAFSGIHTMFSTILKEIAPEPGCFMILTLYPLLASALEPIYLNEFNHFRYPRKHSDVPMFIFLGWGLVMTIIVIVSHCVSSLLRFCCSGLVTVIGTSIVSGILIEYLGTQSNSWNYDRRRLNELSKRSRLHYCLFKPIKKLGSTPVLHIVGYPLLALMAYTIIYVHNGGWSVFLPQDIVKWLFMWISGLVIWFFGLYKFTEHELSSTVKRLKELRNLREKGKTNLDSPIEAQETVIRDLKGFKRVLIVHVPGIIVGIVIPYFLLLAVLSVSELITLSTHRLIALLFMALMLLIVLSIIGAVILAHAFRRRPESKYLEVILNLDDDGF